MTKQQTPSCSWLQYTSEDFPYTRAESEGPLDTVITLLPENGDKEPWAQVRSLLKKLNSILEQTDRKNAIVLQTFFLRDPDLQPVIERELRDFFGDEVPITTFIHQPPCEEQYALALELIAASLTSGRTLERRSEQALRLSDPRGVSFAYLGGLIPPNDSGPLAWTRSIRTFERMEEQLSLLDFSRSDLFRTWLYQGAITGAEGTTQRYKELNRARTDFFEGTVFLKGYQPHGIDRGTIYPASTGIGTQNNDITMSAVAVRSSVPDLFLVPLENPVQTSAFDYGAVYSPQSPKFSRAMALAWRKSCTVFVSGTASITESETVFVGDPEKQTEQTLDNIAGLFTRTNLTRYGLPGFEAALNDMLCVRVYVKRPEYYETIRSVCERRLGSVPTIYVYADVCRDDLLVEIEGIAYCRYVGSETEGLPC